MKALGILCLALFAVFVTPGVALAHASLQSTEPFRETVVAAPPESIVLTFDQPVEAALSSIRLFESDGDTVLTSTPRHPNGDGSRLITTPRGMSTGTYVVAWKTTSADGHPLRGAFTFQVGSGVAANTSQLTTDLLSNESGSRVTGLLMAAARLGTLIGMACFGGGVLLLLWLWPGGWQQRHVRRFLAIAGLLLGMATICAVALQGPYAAQLPLRSALLPSTWVEVADTRFGLSSLSRLLLLVAFLSAWWWAKAKTFGVDPHASPSQPRLWLRLLLSFLVIAVYATLSVSGHALSGPHVPIRLISDVIHVTAMGMWIGGLALLATAWWASGRKEIAPGLVQRFPLVALAAVVALVVTGVLQAWLESGSLYALSTSAYGSVLALKVVVFACLVVLAGVVRGRLRKQSSANDASTTGTLLLAEVLLATAVLLVTSVLINLTPARALPGEPFSAEMVGEGLLVDVAIDSSKVGTTAFHFYSLEPSGRLVQLQELAVRMRLPDKDIGPIEIPLQNGGPGHAYNQSVRLPLSGHWELDVVARTSTGRTQRLSTSFVVR